jgi:hypothetical protein
MFSAVRRLPSRLCSALAVAAVGSFLCSAAAQADAVTSSGSCPGAPVSQPFAPWGDSSSYELAPGGDFEAPGWALDGGATLAGGSEPFAATGSLGRQSLSLPAGADATSPSFCMDAGKPTLRLFTAGGGLLEVQIVADGATIPVGIVAASTGWAPSPILLTGGSLLGPLSGGTVQARIRVSALTGQPQVDDVFVDPWRRG